MTITDTCGRLVIPQALVADVLNAYHNSPFGGHLGIQKTYQRVALRYYWESMWTDIQHHVSQCEACLKAKPKRFQESAQQPRAQVPTRPFEVISMDYIGKLVRSEDFDYVLVIVDVFTRWAIAVPTSGNSAETTARILMEEVICKHGTPAVILSDNGSHFKNQIMNTLYTRFGVDKRWTSTYHPQSNGLVERVNGTIKQIIRTLSQEQLNQWINYLQPAVFAYNTSPSAITGMSPFFVLYGYLPRIPMDIDGTIEQPASESDETKADIYATHLHQKFEEIYRRVRELYTEENLHAYQQQMSLTRFPVYEPGDQVWLKTPPGRVSSSRHRVTTPYYGPFVVLSRLGQVNYLIQPMGKPRARTEVVHFIRLKRHQHGDNALLQPASGSGATLPLALPKPPAPVDIAMPALDHDISMDEDAHEEAEAAPTTTTTTKKGKRKTQFDSEIKPQNILQQRRTRTQLQPYSDAINFPNISPSQYLRLSQPPRK